MGKWYPGLNGTLGQTCRWSFCSFGKKLGSLGKNRIVSGSEISSVCLCAAILSDTFQGHTPLWQVRPEPAHRSWTTMPLLHLALPFPYTFHRYWPSNQESQAARMVLFNYPPSWYSFPQRTFSLTRRIYTLWLFSWVFSCFIADCWVSWQPHNATLWTHLLEWHHRRRTTLLLARIFYCRI